MYYTHSGTHTNTHKHTRTQTHMHPLQHRQQCRWGHHTLSHSLSLTHTRETDRRRRWRRLPDCTVLWRCCNFFLLSCRSVIFYLAVSQMPKRQIFSKKKKPRCGCRGGGRRGAPKKKSTHSIENTFKTSSSCRCGCGCGGGRRGAQSGRRNSRRRRRRRETWRIDRGAPTCL